MVVAVMVFEKSEKIMEDGCIDEEICRMVYSV